MELFEKEYLWSCSKKNNIELYRHRKIVKMHDVKKSYLLKEYV